MQTLQTVRHQDRLLSESDVNSAIQVVSSLPVATKDDLGSIRFLTATHDVALKVGTATIGSVRVYAGETYECASYYYTNPTTGLKTLAYRWDNLKAVEKGKLGAFSNVVFDRKAQADSCVTVRINWEDPVDNADASDVSKNARWDHTVIVRKQGTVAPTTIYDGTVIGYSSVRNQYKSGTGFVDVFAGTDVNAFSYTLFAVTVGGVITSSQEGGEETLNWAKIKAKIAAGEGGDIFAVGDTVTVNHETFGELELQVVGFDNADITGATHSVTFMSRNVLMRAAYDVKERGINDAAVINPGDTVESVAAYSSLRGKADWKTSNLRNWLNGTNVRNSWDKLPSVDNGDAAYVHGGLVVSDFMTGLDAEFKAVLSTVKVKTLTDQFVAGTTAPIQTITEDKVFIPSYRELFGIEPLGMRAYSIHEGTRFPYFDPEVEIPGLGSERSVIKYDENNNLSGYYLRTCETVEDTTSGGWKIKTASGLWCVDSTGHTTKPTIDTKAEEVTSTRGAHMTADEAEVMTTPGIVFCVAIGG